MSKKKKKGDKKAVKKDKYAHLRKRGEYKPKDEVDVDKGVQQDGDQTIDKFYRFSKFGRVNKNLKSKNSRKTLRI